MESRLLRSESAGQPKLGTPLVLPRWLYFVCAALLAWTAALFIALAVHSLPIFDDFCRASANPSTEVVPQSAHTGIFQATVWSYLNWSGRWLAVSSEIALMHPIDIVGFYPALLIGFWIGCITLTYLFFRLVYPTHGGLVNTAFWMLIFGSTPDAGSTLLSLTFALENTGVVALAMALCALMEASPRSVFWTRVSRGTVLLLAVGIPGIHELTGIVLFVAIGFWTWATHMRRVDGVRFRVAVLLALAIGVAISVLAPGNAVRGTVMFADTSLSVAAVNTVSQFISASKQWLFGDLRLWMVTLLLACFTAANPQAPPGSDHPQAPPRRDHAVARIAFLAVLLLSFAIPSVAMKNAMPGRTVGQIYALLMAAWFVIIRVEVSAWVRNTPVDRRLLVVVGSIAALVFCGSVAFDGNARLAVRDVRFGNAAQWHEEHMHRINTLRAAGAEGRGAAVVPPIAAIPHLLPRPNDSDDPDYAANLCMEWYFEVPRISVRRTATP